jgi:hypothetical protein
MPDDYLAFVGTLIDAVKRGDFQLIKADCPLEEVLKTATAEDAWCKNFAAWVAVRCSNCTRTPITVETGGAANSSRRCRIDSYHRCRLRHLSHER